MIFRLSWTPSSLDMNPNVHLGFNRVNCIRDATLQLRNVQCRLAFHRPRARWTSTDWRRVTFSDEAFSLVADDRHMRV
ncbi:hypothetical protein TNCV_4936571 [Trichonephila clavipes]|nr:hypothetical protein TNCV_4936571 [Trichonephila clavipes]